MICAEVIGGLGNQLFIYAMARAMQLDTGEPILMYEFAQQNKDGTIYTKYVLDKLVSSDVSLEYKSTTRPNTSVFAELSSPAHYFFYRLTEKSWKALHLNKKMTLTDLYNMEKCLQPFWNRAGICRVTNGFIPVKRGKSQHFVCSGYYQSKRFWQKYEETIRNELCRPDLIRNENVELIEQMQSTVSICLHMRFGDYIEDPAVREKHFVCGTEYYLTAIEQAMRDFQNPTFFLFTNDPVAVQDIHFPADARIVRISSKNSAIEDMQLMAQCKHFIIPNSSYSWWGQFLGKYPQKRVYAPAKWYRKSDVPCNIYDSNWTLIDTQLPCV